MMEYEEKVALCALNKIFGYHPGMAVEMMEAAGGAAELFRIPLPETGRHPELIQQIGPESLDWAEKELERVYARGFRFIAWGEEDYPDSLRECPAPPLGIYLNGSSSPAQIFGLHPMVAVVGTRDISPYGRAWCARIVRALADAPVQPCIVSGLALGTDGIAHKTALECGLPTLGVMATGIEKVYPWQHGALAARMVGAPGSGVLTDYPTGTSPVALNFVRRNRIIAGLARAVIVVESKSRGGSLMTAKYACEYSKDVFALPGRADDVRSAGCNSLIREHMADIITTPEDLVFRLGLGSPPRRGSGGSWATGPEGYRNALERKYGDGRTAEKGNGVGPGPSLSSGLGPSLCTGPGPNLSSGPSPTTADQNTIKQTSCGPGPAPKTGPGPEAVLLGMTVFEQRGIGPEELSAQLGLPISRVLELIGILEADGFLTTDLLRRCAAKERR